MTSSKLMWSRLTVRPEPSISAVAVCSIRCSVSWSESRGRRASPRGPCAAVLAGVTFIELHGVSHAVRFTASVGRAGNSIYVLADITLPFADGSIVVQGVPWLADIQSPGTIEVLLDLTQGAGNAASVASAAAGSRNAAPWGGMTPSGAGSTAADIRALLPGSRTGPRPWSLAPGSDPGTPPNSRWWDGAAAVASP